MYRQFHGHCNCIWPDQSFGIVDTATRAGISRGKFSEAGIASRTHSMSLRCAQDDEILILSRCDRRRAHRARWLKHAHSENHCMQEAPVEWELLMPIRENA
jgi:hypothetical protein